MAEKLYGLCVTGLARNWLRYSTMQAQYFRSGLHGELLESVLLHMESSDAEGQLRLLAHVRPTQADQQEAWCQTLRQHVNRKEFLDYLTPELMQAWPDMCQEGGQKRKREASQSTENSSSKLITAGASVIPAIYDLLPSAAVFQVMQ